jgi:pimeloyl-ACP methyl ester carboxylesterase
MKKIILLHGALGAEAQLQPLKELLSKNFEVYLYTFSGHGSKSDDTSPFSMEQLANELGDFIDENKLIQPAIFGYSMGGYAALTLAAANPRMIGAIITLGTKFDWSPEAAQEESKFLNPDKTTEKVPDFAAYLHQLHGAGWPTLMRNTAGMLTDLGTNHLLPDDISVIQNNVLLLLGDADNMVTREETEETKKHIPHASVQILPETPHALEKTDAALLAKAITDFI